MSSEIFKTLFDFLEAHPGTTRIALYYGDTGAGAFGTGTDYHDGAAPFGDDAFAVWRFDTNGGRAWPFYIMVSCPSAENGKASGELQKEGANTTSSSGYVIVSACVGVGGDENPWNGSENDDGTDTTGTPVWANPGGGGTNYHPMPASNRATSGSDAATGNNGLEIYFLSAPVAATRFHFLADDDNFVWVADMSDNNSTVRVGHIGIYEPPSHLTPDRPFVAFRATMEWAEITTYGPETGGIANPDSTDLDPSVVRLDLGWDATQFTTALQPSEVGDTPDSYVPQRVQIMNDLDVGFRGFYGHLPTLIEACHNIPAGDVDAALERVAIGQNVATLKALVQMGDGSTTPGTGTTRAGTAFP